MESSVVNPVEVGTQNYTHLTKLSSPDDFFPYLEAVSLANSLPDGTPVPPTSRHFGQASKEGWGVSDFTVKKVLGSIVCGQEMLGFVMPTTVRKWSEEDFLENGHWISHMLGTPEEPIMPSYDDVGSFSKLHLAPSPVVITEIFGGVDSLQDRLGWVNAKVTLKRWTDQDWIDNGKWLSHMLGTPDEPKMPSYEDMRLAANLNIGPSMEEVRKKFVSLVAYQKLLGFEPLDKPLAHEEWPKPTYIENGKWLSHMLGTPDEPKMPTSGDIHAGYKIGICPPFSAIKKRFRSFSRYQDALGFVTNVTLKRWTDQDWIDNGKWLSHMLGTPDEPKMPSYEDMRTGSRLNISPNQEQIKEKFGSMHAYQEALGFTNEQAIKKALSRRDILRQALDLQRSLKRTPKHQDYIDAGIPVKRIYRDNGTLANFHEQLEIPNYHNWNRDQLIGFGVLCSVSNATHQPPNRCDIRSLRSAGRSPSLHQIETEFGEFEKYKSSVEEAIPLWHQLHKAISTIYSPIGLPEFLLKNFVPTDEYAESQIKLADQMYGLSRAEYVGLSPLMKMFARSRITLLWDKSDFMDFGEKAFGQRNLDTQNCLRKLTVLQEAGLTPYPQDIDDEFGSQEVFIAESLQTLAAA